jgi:2-polyprenyl-3-methyl-5-hydroxy-6-metoxy-1,4-benzoquinol methylase
MDPMPSDDDLRDLYQEYDSLGESSQYFRGLAQSNALDTPEGKDFADRADWILSRVPDPSTALDVGAGTGFFLEVMKNRGVLVEGVELNAKAATAAAQRTGVEVHSGTVDDLPPRRYKTATLWDVIEHVNDPAGMLRRVHGLLEEGGWAFIETPDEGALLDRSILLLNRVGVQWPAEMFYGIHHIVLFRPATIRKLLEMTGFETIEIHHTETRVQRVFDRNRLQSLVPWLGVSALFVTARVVGMQNKMLIAARKR